MSGSKHFDRIAMISIVLTLVITILFMNGGVLGIEAMARTMGYENRLFDNSRVHTIDIVMTDWDDFIATATNEEYHSANISIDGEAYKNVAIRAKGNTSLTTVASLGSERYSFKIEFDHYDGSMTYHGLDKLSLNNLIQDSTMMKDYLTYTMMNEFGVNSSLCSYVYITVNGEDWGLYLAVEGVEEAFMERNYGNDYGELYKPDSTGFGGGRGNGMDFDIGAFNFNNNENVARDNARGESGFDPSSIGAMPDIPSFEEGELPDGFELPGNMGELTIPAEDDSRKGKNEGFAGGMGIGSSDVKLQYIDDQIDSYSNIWNNAKTDISESDQSRLIASLKKLSSNEDIPAVVDIDQVIRYFVVHNYVCNGDSYTGSMVHNYYLYEKDGRLALIPWDYNLAFGTFGGGSATDEVNTPIDSPTSGGSADRPMLNWIFESEEYTELYHRYFSDFLSNVEIDEIINSAYELIKGYVEKDPTAFYSYDEFEKGVATLRSFCDMRSRSIAMQLDNSETETNMNYVDASAINLSDMGSMGGNMGGRNDFGGNLPDIPGGMSVPEAPDMLEHNGDAGADSSDRTSDNMPESQPPNGQQEGMPSNDRILGNRQNGENMREQERDFTFEMNGDISSQKDHSTWIWLSISVVVLAAGLVVAKIYR